LYWSRVGRVDDDILEALRLGRNPHCTGAGLEALQPILDDLFATTVAILIVLEQGWKNLALWPIT